MTAIIDLGKRFDPDLTKRRRGDAPGGDWRAWNAANPTHPKDARGRWTDNPIGQAIAQAFSNIRHHRATPEQQILHISDIRAELGDRFPRADVDAELRRLGMPAAAGGDPDVTLIPQSNRKVLTEAQRAGAVSMGNEEKHLLQMRHKDLPAPSRVREDRERMIRQLEDMGLEGSFKGWDPEDVAKARDAAKRLAAAAEGELKARKAAPKKPRATARVTGKPTPAVGSLKDEQGYRADAALIADRSERRHHLAQASRMYGATPQEAMDNTNTQAQTMAESMGVDLSGLSKDKRGRYNLAQMLDAMADATGPGKEGRPRATVPPTPLGKPAPQSSSPSGLERLMGGRWEKPAPAHRTPDQHVREVFAELKTPSNEWVGLADLREKLEARGLSREQQDAAFRDMLRHDADVRIIPVANSKALKPRDRQAALLLGGVNPVHAMSIDDANRQWQNKPPRPARAPETAAQKKPRATARLKGRERRDPAALAVLLEGRTPSDAADKLDELNLNLADLRDLATHLQIKGRSKMRKAELFGAIANRGGVPGRATPTPKPRLNSRTIREGIWDKGREEWASAVARTLEGMTSVPEGKAMLGSFSKAQLQELAAEVGIRGASSASKSKLIDEIVWMKIQGPMTLRRAMNEEPAAFPGIGGGGKA